MEFLNKYFPEISDDQRQQLAKLAELMTEWNAKINLISRKDIENLELHHIVHSLAIARFTGFKKGSNVLDLGTGGGFPGLPLAILFPEVNFKLIDARAKKIMVVKDMIEKLGLTNVDAEHIRAEELKSKYDFVVTRAVASLDTLFKWSQRLIGNRQSSSIPNGLIALKGGEVKQETGLLPKGSYSEVEPISGYFSEPYFDEKFVVYVQI